MSTGTVWMLSKQTVSEWMEDRAMRLSASLAFWTMLSIAPLVVVTIKIVGMLFGEQAAAGQVETYLVQFVGQQNAETIQNMVQQAGAPGQGVWATIISLGILVWSASYVFVELQDALNTVWEVKPKPGLGVWATIRSRIFSLGLVLAVAFLLVASLVLSTVLSAVTAGLGEGSNMPWLWQAIDFLVSFAVLTALFALMFRYVPDARIAWRHVWIGAALTAVLFTIGKFVLGLYLGREGATDIYGTAGSLVALLLWVYYSAMILFMGAEFTQVYARHTDGRIKPAENAVKVTEEDRAQRGIPHRGALGAAASGTPVNAGAPAVTGYIPAEYETHYVWKKPATMSVAMMGLLAGAAMGGLGALFSARKRAHERAMRVNERIYGIEQKLGPVEEIRRQAMVARISDHLSRIEGRIRRDADIADYIHARHVEEEKSYTDGDHRSLRETGRDLWQDLKHVGEKLKQRLG
jgi:membrane protein